MNDSSTFASTTTRCTSDTPSALTSLMNGFDDVARAVLDDAFPSEECRPLGRDCDASAVHFPRELVSRCEVECVADFLRDRCLALAGDGRSRHGWYGSLPRIPRVRRTGNGFTRSSRRGGERALQLLQRDLHFLGAHAAEDVAGGVDLEL